MMTLPIFQGGAQLKTSAILLVAVTFSFLQNSLSVPLIVLVFSLSTQHLHICPNLLFQMKRSGIFDNLSWITLSTKILLQSLCIHLNIDTLFISYQITDTSFQIICLNVISLWAFQHHNT